MNWASNSVHSTSCFLFLLWDKSLSYYLLSVEKREKVRNSDYYDLDSTVYLGEVVIKNLREFGVKLGVKYSSVEQGGIKYHFISFHHNEQ